MNNKQFLIILLKRNIKLSNSFNWLENPKKKKKQLKIKKWNNYLNWNHLLINRKD